MSTISGKQMSKSTLLTVTIEIVDRTVSQKLHWTVFDSNKGEVTHAEIPENLKNEPSISDDEVIKLAEIGKKIEKHYGRPQDIEWAVDRDVSAPDNIFITQSRPETVWSEKKKSIIGKKSAYDLIMNRALTPFKLPK